MKPIWTAPGASEQAREVIADVVGGPSIPDQLPALPERCLIDFDGHGASLAIVSGGSLPTLERVGLIGHRRVFCTHVCG